MAEAVKLFKDADSRLKGYKGLVTHPTERAQRTYCFLCGKPSGYCSQDSSQFAAPSHIVVTCSDCDATMFLLGAQPVPQNILDAYGLIPEPLEIAVQETPNVLV